MTYDRTNGNDHGDEIRVIQRDQTLFKGYLKTGGKIFLSHNSNQWLFIH